MRWNLTQQVRATVLVNQYYCSYFPYNAKLGAVHRGDG